MAQLKPHPRNPRLIPREDVIEAIRSSLVSAGSFDPAHALIVRPIDDGYEILSGHNRTEAAKRSEIIAEIPCWIRELDDDAAYMLLATSNAQGELSPLERGMHALHSGLDPKAYAERSGRARTTVQREVLAARVVAETDIGLKAVEHFSQLVEIHAAPSWLWPALVAAMLDPKNDWSVEQTRTAIARFRDLPEECPAWVSDKVPADLVEGKMRVSDVARITKLLEETAVERRALIDEIIELEMKLAPPQSVHEVVDQTALPFVAGSSTEVRSEPPPIIIPTYESYSDALTACEQSLSKLRERRNALQRELEDAEERASRLFEYVSLEEWRTLDKTIRSVLLPPDPERVSVGNFNKQESDAIEWAQWSWNPITGCLHDCPYCYAKEIAESKRVEKVYPNKFAPTLRPRSLLVPRVMSVPKEAMFDTRYRNVFTGSMADMFGRWVPSEWIEAVLQEMRGAAGWNFLCLTKFPKRLTEFDIPTNAWMGTTVDLQARVPAAEAAFANIGAKVKWISVEPMLEPIRFKYLNRFDWLVIGGSSRTNNTPEWHPPYAWIRDLEKQADDAGVKVYMKSNLFGRNTKEGYQGNARRLELPFDAPITPDPEIAPEVFHYLGNDRSAA